jgi:hypothetical protein
MTSGKVNTVRRMGDWGGTFSTHQEEGKNSALGKEMRRKNLLKSSGIERKIILKLF